MDSKHSASSSTIDLWTSKSSIQLVRYYKVFCFTICPTCPMIVSNTKELIDDHRLACGFEKIDKFQLYINCLRDGKLSYAAAMRLYDLYSMGQEFYMGPIHWMLNRGLLDLHIEHSQGFYGLQPLILIEQMPNCDARNQRISEDGTQRKSKCNSVFVNEESGLQPSDVNKQLSICDYDQHSRENESLSTFIETPTAIRVKKCVVNIRNKYDNLCFLYSILYLIKINGISNCKPNRANIYKKYLSELKYDDTEMPMKISGIEKFECDNPHIAINVIKYCPRKKALQNMKNIMDHPDFELIYKTKQSPSQNLMYTYLLYVEDNNCGFHYMAITNVQRLLNNHKTGCSTRRIQSKVCYYCLNMSRSTLALKKHEEQCEQKLRYAVKH